MNKYVTNQCIFDPSKPYQKNNEGGSTFYVTPSMDLMNH